MDIPTGSSLSEVFCLSFVRKSDLVILTQVINLKRYSHGAILHQEICRLLSKTKQASQLTVDIGVGPAREKRTSKQKECNG